MKKLAVLFLFSCLTLQSSGQNPSIDSLDRVAVHRWFISALISEVTYSRHKIQIADSLIEMQQAGIELAFETLARADSLIKIQEEQIRLRDEATRIQTERIMNYQGENGELKKEIKKQKLLTVAVGVFGLILVLIAL